MGPGLPIDAHVASIRERLRQARALVRVAPPGSGKTTRVPPALVTIPGGKDTRPPLPGQFLQAGHSLLEEALAPLADDLARRIEALGDLIVAQSLRGIQHDLGADDVTMR